MLMILKENKNSETNLELISCAGATGLLNISWRAHKSYTHQIIETMKKSNFKVEIIKEISNYSST
jgi:reverse gyrase